MKKNGVITIILFIISIILYIVGMISFSNNNTTVGSICTSFGFVFLGCGVFLSRKQR